MASTAANDGARARPTPAWATLVVPYAACWAYAVRPASLSIAARFLAARVKAADPHWLARGAHRAALLAGPDGPLAGCFVPGAVAVPVPPCRSDLPAAAWPSTRLADALVAAGLATAVWPGLERRRSVPKSAFAAPGRRPRVGTLCESLAIAGEPPVDVLLVDDVVTRGRTLLAAAACVRGACATARLRAFALLHVPQREQRCGGLVAPVRGEIRWADADVVRSVRLAADADAGRGDRAGATVARAPQRGTDL